MPTAVIANRRSDLGRQRMNGRDQFLDTGAAKRISVQGRVQLRHLGGMVLGVMDLHRPSVEMGLKGIVCIGKVR